MRTKNKKNYNIIENFIGSYWENTGFSPSIRDIAEGTGFSKTTVSRYMDDMKADGRIESFGHRNILTKNARKETAGLISVPVLGRVSCGLPKFAEENIEDYYYMPKELLGSGRFFYLYANGESMIEADINDGDLILVRQQRTAEPGQVVIAMVGPEEATMKHFYPEPENHRIRLHPENSAMEDIYVDDCEIQGVAVKLMREIN